MQDVVVYGTGPVRSGPWLTEHNLAYALAAERRVLFVEPPITPLTPFRYGLRARLFDDVRRVLSVGVRSAKRVDVLLPVTVPPREHRKVVHWSAPIVRAQVRRAVRGLGLNDPFVLAARSVVPLLGASGDALCVYLAKDLVEAGADLIGKDSQWLAEAQLAMCERADLVCAVTPALQARLAERGVDAALLPHGFHADLAAVYDTAVPPIEYESAPRPLIGYAGHIDARLDFAALASLADHIRSGSLILVGPVSPRLARAELKELRARPNVHFLGPRAREDVPAYLRYLDCTVLPYRSSEWLSHGSPLKLWDALYAGPPIVGLGCTALLDHPGVIFAGEPQGFPEAVDTALGLQEDGREARRAYALENSWDRRAEMLLQLLADRM